MKIILLFYEAAFAMLAIIIYYNINLSEYKKEKHSTTDVQTIGRYIPIPH